MGDKDAHNEAVNIRALDGIVELETYLGAVEKLATGEPQIALEAHEWAVIVAQARGMAERLHGELDPPLACRKSWPEQCNDVALACARASRG